MVVNIEQREKKGTVRAKIFSLSLISLLERHSLSPHFHLLLNYNN